ncbi:MAG: LUD domain-containing protein [Verrucomicrobiae bacterium]|nr:LUD domain-containing protein [Verrucomicrobiae bacterium]
MSGESERDKVFASIRSALAKVEKSPRPEIDLARIVAKGRLDGQDLWQAFASNFTGVRGIYVDTLPALVETLQKHNLKTGFCDPAFRKSIGEPLEEFFTIEYSYPRERVDDLQFAITRGSAVIAETGTILLKDRDSVNRLATVAPWMHIAVVSEDSIYRSVHDALVRFDHDPNIVWVTGPSKTGDIEGILIEGVHGPGEQVCFRH